MFFDAHRNRRRIIDEHLWLMGAYVQSAVSTSLSNAFNKKSKAKYIDKPIMKEMEDNNKELSQEDIAKQRDLFVKRLMAMKTNYDINNKDGMGS